jgi:hypothetical protein
MKMPWKNLWFMGYNISKTITYWHSYEVPIMYGVSAIDSLLNAIARRDGYAIDFWFDLNDQGLWACNICGQKFIDTSTEDETFDETMDNHGIIHLQERNLLPFI